MSKNLLNAVLRQDAAECANFVSICIQLRHVANVIINAGFVMIQSDRVGVGRFTEGVRAKDFPLRNNVTFSMCCTRQSAERAHTETSILQVHSWRVDRQTVLNIDIFRDSQQMTLQHQQLQSHRV